VIKLLSLIRLQNEGKKYNPSEDYDCSTSVCKSFIILSVMDSEKIPQDRKCFRESQNPVGFMKPLSMNFSLLNSKSIQDVTGFLPSFQH